MDHETNYHRKVSLKLLNEFAESNYLIQIVDFNTWSRNINGIKKSLLKAMFKLTILQQLKVSTLWHLRLATMC